MKKILALLIIVLLCGCGIKEKEKTVDCILKPYAELISEENRQNLVIYYDYDGVFDRYTISSLVSRELADVSALDLSDKKEETKEQIADKYNSFYKTLTEKMTFIFNYEYESLEKATIDENTIRIIIDSDDVRFYIYEGGYIKIIDNGVRTFYHTKNSSFNKDLENFYKTVKEMGNYGMKLATSIE